MSALLCLFCWQHLFSNLPSPSQVHFMVGSNTCGHSALTAARLRCQALECIFPVAVIWVRGQLPGRHLSHVFVHCLLLGRAGIKVSLDWLTFHNFIHSICNGGQEFAFWYELLQGMNSHPLYSNFKALFRPSCALDKVDIFLKFWTRKLPDESQLT